MSGGAYDYAYAKVEEMAVNLRHSTTPIEYRAWFAEHLRLVSAAMRALEWEDSGDTGPEDSKKAVMAVIKHGQRKFP